MNVYSDRKNKLKKRIDKLTEAYDYAYSIALETHNELTRIKKTLWYKIGDFFGLL